MTQQIIKIEADPIDDGVMQITLRQEASGLKFWKKQELQIITYKGYGKHWYSLPNFQPAPNKIIPFLKQIFQGRQFRHLRVNLKGFM